MSGRRPRLVIKPNISRPGAGAAKTTPVSKPKSSLETHSKPSPATASAVEKITASENENQKDKEERTKPSEPEPAEGISNSSTNKPKLTAGKKSDSEQCVKIADSRADLQIPPSTEASTTNSKDACLTEMGLETSNTAVLRSKTPKPTDPQQQDSSTARVTTITVKETADHAPDLTKAAILKIEGEKRPDQQLSELDQSEASVASSLEPDNERQTEVEETSGKKPRRHKSNKPKLEALPSRDKSPDRQKMKMSDLLLWNPERNFLPSKPKKKRNLKDENRPTSPSEREQEDEKAKAVKENESAALPAPQVMIGPDGNVVLNTESLLISTPEKEGRSKIIVEEDDEDRYLNTNSYRKYHKKKLWSEEETDKFFLGLSMCGTDFSLLTKLLTNRSRRELKNKFRREEKHNRPRVDRALSNMRQYDPSVFVEEPPPPPKPKVKKMPKENKVAKSTKPPDLLAKQAKVPAKKEPQASKKKAKKRKIPDSSEDEEDDWGPEYDEIDEEEEMAARIPAFKKKSGKNTPEEGKEAVQAKQGSVFVPSGPERPGSIQVTTEPVPSSFTAVGDATSAQVQVPKPPKGIQAIPGTTQVQIEVSGVQTPVQGMLIPSHMVPTLAPQLGLGEGVLGGRVQVLLVHEESADGSLVHVYIIPEDDSATPASSATTQGSAAMPISLAAGGASNSATLSTPGAVPTGAVAAPINLAAGGASNSASLSTPGAVIPTGAHQSVGQGQTQHPLHRQANRNTGLVHPGASASSSSSSSFSHQQQTPPGGYSVTVGASPYRVQSPFPPTPPVPTGAQPQRTFTSFSPKVGVLGVKSSSPFPPVPLTGMKSPSHFPPYGASSRGSPSPYLQAGAAKSPASFPPTSRAGTSSSNPSPVGLRPQSPFPPVQTGKRISPFPYTKSPAQISTLPRDAAHFPMSPPPLQGHRPLDKIQKPKPQVQDSHNLVRDIYSESMASPSSQQSNPPSTFGGLHFRTDMPVINSVVTGLIKDNACAQRLVPATTSQVDSKFIPNSAPVLTAQISNTDMIVSGQSLNTSAATTRISAKSTVPVVETHPGSRNPVHSAVDTNVAGVFSEDQGSLSVHEIESNAEEDQDFAVVGKIEVISATRQQQN